LIVYNMKSSVVALGVLSVVLCLLGFIQSQSLEWINEVTKDPGFQIIRPSFLRSDAQDNIYVVKLETVSSPGGTAGLAQILKYNSTGSLQWTVNAPSNTINPVGWFDVADDGSSFITGSNLVIGQTFTNGFVQKFDTNGVFQWEKIFANSVMGRAVPLPGGLVRVEVSVINGPKFANTYDAAGVLLSTVPMTNVVVSTGPLDPVTASKSNSLGNFCGVLPLSGPNFFFEFVQLNATGDIIWSQPVSGIFFASAASQILIDETGNCLFVGTGSNMTVGPLSFPPNELRTNFLTFINSAGVPQLLKVYDFQTIDGVACGALPTAFSRCWISAIDLDGRPALARLNAAFDINDLFVGQGITTTRSFKIVFNTRGRLAGAFSTGQATGTWFGAPIVVPPNPNDFPGALFVFQLNLGTTTCDRTRLCATGDNCCSLSNGQTACFSPSRYSCFTQPGKLCPTGLLPCGNDCYSLSVYSCVNSSLCPVGTLHCGRACYNPFQFSCFEGNRLCPQGTLLCGNACYNPDTFNCCDGRLCPIS